MHKILAEIIAGLIPDRMSRNRWRGILRYGLANAIRLKKELRHTANDPANYMAICAIAKDEGPYLKEWIEWHLKNGVEKFYIYDNGSKDDTTTVLKPYIEKGIVEYTYYPGYRRQIASYDDCLRRHRHDSRWIAFIDIDEFIVPVRDNSIIEFVRRLEEYPAVEINWLVYGSGGIKTKKPGDVMARFKYHSRPDNILNRHVKSIVNPRKVFTMTGCHEAARMTGRTVDSHGDIVTVNFKHREPQHDVIRINHYAVKSLEEFREKCSKGRASGRKRSIDMNYFHMYDLNDIKDN
jgi:hypothetical protein